MRRSKKCYPFRQGASNGLNQPLKDIKKIEIVRVILDTLDTDRTVKCGENDKDLEIILETYIDKNWINLQ